MDMPKNGEFCWNELITQDTKKAGTFYSELFGWKTEEHVMDNITYTMFKNNDQDIGGMLTPPMSQIPAHWLSYINVDDLEATVEKAVQLGAKIKRPITPVSDFGKLAIIEDPTGACFGLWKVLKKFSK